MVVRFILLFLLFSCSVSAEFYFYCISEDGSYYQLSRPLDIEFEVKGAHIVVGETITLGDLSYVINKEDLEKGDFKSVLRTPFAYFVYPSSAGNSYQINEKLIGKCRELIRKHDSDKKFEELRISESVLSGYMGKPGYPAVFINLGDRNKQNIFRIDAYKDWLATNYRLLPTLPGALSGRDFQLVEESNAELLVLTTKKVPVPATFETSSEINQREARPW